MTEQNLFTPLGSIDLYNDSIGKVTLYDASHANNSEEQRIWTVTTIASLAYGNESAKNPEELYKRMQSIKHESLWECIRIGIPPFETIKGSMRSNIPAYDIPSAYSSLHKENIACFRIKVPIFVARQFMRHRSFSYLEMSRRYTKDAKVPFQFWFPPALIGEGSAMVIEEEALELYSNICEMYHTQIASRFLPQTTYTEFYMMGEIEGLKNFFRLRLDPHAQAEIRECAEAMLKLLSTYQPQLHKKVINE